MLIAGISGYICNECAEQAHEIARESMQKSKKGSKAGDLDMNELPKPQEIKTFLDQYVIGQDDAKRYLSVSGRPQKLQYCRCCCFAIIVGELWGVKGR
jgi:ATP-dependent Clp protease ATP-binding subunit ClpX